MSLIVISEYFNKISELFPVSSVYIIWLYVMTAFFDTVLNSFLHSS